MFEGLQFGVADVKQRQRALDLRRRVYAQDWPNTPIGKDPIDEWDARAYHLVAWDGDGTIIACCRIVGPDQRPFDLERFVDLSTVVAPERSPALVGRMCVHHDYRTVSSKVILPIGMLKASYELARKQDFTDFVMFTFSHLIRFYQSAFFRLVNISFDNPEYCRRSEVMHLDLVDLRNRQAHSQSPMARLLLATDLPNFHV